MPGFRSLDVGATRDRFAPSRQTSSGGEGASSGDGDILSRRELLRRGAILGAAAAFPSLRATSVAAGQDPYVVVVGGGLAGVTCAYRLAQAGVHVTLHEASDRLGGRCFTDRTFAGGQIAERGGELIDSRHKHIRKLVHELGLQLEGRGGSGPGKDILELDGKINPNIEYRYFREFYDQLAADVKRAHLVRIQDYFFDRLTPEARALDEMSMTEWFDTNLPGSAGSYFRQWLDIEITNFYGLEPEFQSALGLHLYYWTISDGADFAWHVHGGNDLITRRMARRLPQGTIRLGSPLRALWRGRNGPVHIRFGDDRKPILADHVVLTLPFTALQQVDLDRAGFAARRLRAIDELGMATESKLLLQFRSKAWYRDGWNGHFQTDNPTSQGNDRARLFRQEGRAGLLQILMGGRVGAGFPVDRAQGEAPEAVVRDWLETLGRFSPRTPDAYNGRSWLSSWVDDPWIRGAYAAFLPGQYGLCFGYSHLPDGNVHFGGEHTSWFSQGYLNGGVESGERCAREVQEAFGRR
jgi:monoamine oxidase